MGAHCAHSSPYRQALCTGCVLARDIANGTTSQAPTRWQLAVPTPGALGATEMVPPKPARRNDSATLVSTVHSIRIEALRYNLSSSENARCQAFIGMNARISMLICDPKGASLSASGLLGRSQASGCNRWGHQCSARERDIRTYTPYSAL